MTSIFRGRGPRRWLALAVLALIVGAIAGAGLMPARETTAQTPAVVVFTKVIENAQGNPVPGADVSGFRFTLTQGNQVFETPPTNNAGVTQVSVAPGNYNLDEIPRLGATFTQRRFIVAGNEQGFVAVPNMGMVPVTVRNRQAGNNTIEIRKQILNANNQIINNADRSGFQFQVTSQAGFNQTFTSPFSGEINVTNLAQGNYAVVELPRSGFTLVGAAVGGVPYPNDGTFFGLGGTAPNTQIVVFQNTQTAPTGTIQIQKQVVDANNQPLLGADRSGFQFTVACGANFSLTVTTDGSGVANVNNAPTGNCTISETPRAGFTLGGIFVGTSTTDIGNNGTFQVMGGQTVQLTVRNRPAQAATGTVQIQKSIVDMSGNPVGGASLSNFQFTVNCGGQLFTGTTGGNGQATISNVTAGQCTLQEAPASGFTFVSFTPQGAAAVTTNPGPLTVPAGQTVNVTVVNRQGGNTIAMPLRTGCTNVVSTFPAGTPLAQVAAAVSPAGIITGIFRQDPSAPSGFRAFNPTVPAFANDYLMTSSALEAVFICTTAPGTFSPPA
jgi:hypothetical protein